MHIAAQKDSDRVPPPLCTDDHQRAEISPDFLTEHFKHRLLQRYTAKCHKISQPKQIPLRCSSQTKHLDTLQRRTIHSIESKKKHYFYTYITPYNTPKGDSTCPLLSAVHRMAQEVVRANIIHLKTNNKSNPTITDYRNKIDKGASFGGLGWPFVWQCVLERVHGVEGSLVRALHLFIALLIALQHPDGPAVASPPRWRRRPAACRRRAALAPAAEAGAAAAAAATPPPALGHDRHCSPSPTLSPPLLPLHMQRKGAAPHARAHGEKWWWAEAWAGTACRACSVPLARFWLLPSRWSAAALVFGCSDVWGTLPTETEMRRLKPKLNRRSPNGQLGSSDWVCAKWSRER